MDCKSSIPSSNLGVALNLAWGYGGMVDTTDLKSVDQMVVRVQVPLPPREWRQASKIFGLGKNNS